MKIAPKCCTCFCALSAGRHLVTWSKFLHFDSKTLNLSICSPPTPTPHPSFLLFIYLFFFKFWGKSNFWDILFFFPSVFAFLRRVILVLRGVQANRRPTAIRSNDSGSQMRFPTLLTQHPAGRLLVFQFKTRETRPELKSIQYPTIFLDLGHFFSRFRPIFSRFQSFFHLNPSISGTINTGSGQTSDFSSWFGKNLTRSDEISSDLGWIWQDLVAFWRIPVRSISPETNHHSPATRTDESVNVTGRLRVGQKPDLPDPWTALLVPHKVVQLVLQLAYMTTHQRGKL